ncbi:signal peptide peptidase SppA [Arenimonas sp.]|uniref:signal peptide peptidase SppA n=1 Tax=Arenimonas sp. TaxID=1872635 RepID=UPI0039E429DD
MNQSQARPNPVWSFLVGLWRFVDFANHLFFNLIMGFLLLVFLALVGAAFSASSGNSGYGPLRDKTALVLDLKGTLVEQYTSAPIERAFAQASGNPEREIQLRDLTRAISAAKDDKRIDRIVLLTDGFGVPGFAALRELGAALRDFRSAGKQVIAYGAGIEQKQYYLAAQADEVYLDPSGMVLLEGLGRYRLYYRQALQEKLGVDVHLFRVGEYKSAAEPYILDAASAESREADLFWMNDLWNRYLDDIASARKLSREQLVAFVAAMPERVQAAKGDIAQLALDTKLVDALKTPHQIEELLSERGAFDEERGSFRQIDLNAYLRQLGPANSLIASGDQVAIVVASGEIVDGKQAPGTVGGESTAELIRSAREDENVKAMVLRVDSPGGGVFPSEQIRREVALMREAGKPVVVSMGNVAASGGYWISMNADRIYADPSTITGSIGIFGLWMSAPRALEKIGVHSDGVGTTPLAGAFDITRPLDPNAGAIIQSVIDHGYAQFIGMVAKARDSQPEKIDEVARGRVWSGAQAKERGLVDALGGLREAQAEAAKLAKLEKDKYEVRYVEPQVSPIDQFFLDLSRNARTAAMMRSLGPVPGLLGRDASERVTRELAWLQGGNGTAPIRTVAHCFCGL